MEMKLQIPFQQLLTIVKTLTPSQKDKLREELKEEKKTKSKDDFIDFLLSGPVYNDKDLKTIEENKKSVAKWRTKS